MREHIKISLYVVMAFLISLGTLFSFFMIYDAELLTNVQIEEVESDVENKIFLLGTSYVDVIDTIHVQNILNDSEFPHSVINPPHDTIAPTLEKLDSFLSHKPKLIVYGVGFRDIGYSKSLSCPLSSIPSYSPPINPISLDVPETNTVQENIETNIFSQNPKHMTLEIFEQFLGETKIEHISKSEIIKIIPERLVPQQIRPISDLNKSFSYNHCMDFNFRNSELNNLNTIFAKFYKNNVDVIVFIPPYTESYLNELTPRLQSDTPAIYIYRKCVR